MVRDDVACKGMRTMLPSWFRNKIREVRSAANGKTCDVARGLLALRKSEGRCLWKSLWKVIQLMNYRVRPFVLRFKLNWKAAEAVVIIRSVSSSTLVRTWASSSSSPSRMYLSQEEQRRRKTDQSIAISCNVTAFRKLFSFGVWHRRGVERSVRQRGKRGLRKFHYEVYTMAVLRLCRYLYGCVCVLVCLFRENIGGTSVFLCTARNGEKSGKNVYKWARVFVFHIVNKKWVLSSAYTCCSEQGLPISCAYFFFPMLESGTQRITYLCALIFKFHQNIMPGF